MSLALGARGAWPTLGGGELWPVVGVAHTHTTTNLSSDQSHFERHSRVEFTTLGPRWQCHRTELTAN